ncbi:hypothetical protein KFL_000130490 [Klebsormidium nitens]|uniref:Uncharacterized protein n=1 Tax=Klebsormidium nitens TaxID=105231 RepID=A0A1Y1HPC7_KLENI|nr:hypothetical protein KFL_000130490 [Klebsormidium nitens]|eukprot:GAQ78466.1 hypothetical protein KFL_000130490 [Klebsormidium nitens]
MDNHQETRYRPGPDCATSAVDGLVRAGLAGLVWGVFSSNYDRRVRKSLGFSYVATNTLKTGVTWGTVAATYLGLHCGLERLRRKQDTLNATLAGGADRGYPFFVLAPGSTTLSPHHAALCWDNNSSRPSPTNGLLDAH